MLIMERVVSALTARLLRSAATRWPASMGAERHAEWLAECHALRAESGNSLGGQWRGLRFAASLAARPAVKDQREEPRRLDLQRSRRPASPGELVAPVLALLAAPLVLLVTVVSICLVAEIVCSVLLNGGKMYTSRFVFQADWQAHNHIDWRAHALQIAVIGLCTFIMARFGHWLGGRLPLRVRQKPTAVTAIGSTVVAPIIVACGLLLVVAVMSQGALRARVLTGYVSPDWAGGLATWIVATMVGGWWVTRGRITWRRTVFAALFAADLTTTVAGLPLAHAVGLSTGTAVWWFPLSLLSPDGWGPLDASIEPLTAVSSVLYDAGFVAVTGSCLVLAYCARSARVSLADPGPVGRISA